MEVNVSGIDPKTLPPPPPPVQQVDRTQNLIDPTSLPPPPPPPVGGQYMPPQHMPGFPPPPTAGPSSGQYFPPPPSASGYFMPQPATKLSSLEKLNKNNTLYIKNLNPKIKLESMKQSLFNVFSQNGKIIEIHMK